MKKILIVVALAVASVLFVHGATEEQILRKSECNKVTVYQALKNLNVKYIDVVYAQVMLESGELSSKIFRLNNNMLGMRQPKVRETTSVGKTHGYATYMDWYACLEDYALYQKDVIEDRQMTKKQYITYISKHYAQDPQYKTKIMRKMRDFRTDSLSLASN